MFSLSIALRDNPAMWTLLFKSKETADAAWAKLPATGEVGIFEDDFSQRVFLNLNSVTGAVLEDLEVSKLAHIERALHTARTNAKAHQLAQSDPVLRTAAMGQGPAVLSPIRG